MNKLQDLQPDKVFKYFEEICSIPHSSGNMDKISKYCIDFAKEHNLKYICDDLKNVFIYKPGTKGYENSEPIILQGHLDMVCQKTNDSDIDFENDGLDILTEGDFVFANKTSLGADNGIAVAMIMAILDSDDIPHPPLEALFTTDEETGMFGASAFDTSLLNGRKMINIDSEEMNFVTVSCAGGCNLDIKMPFAKKRLHGKRITLSLDGLKGGHSGVEIDKGRVNANILMGRILSHLNKESDFGIININGGTKANAITPFCRAEIVTESPDETKSILDSYFKIIKSEIFKREENCSLSVCIENDGDFDVLSPDSQDKLLFMLSTTPNGIIDMSNEIPNLVETSLNLGILETSVSSINMIYTLRSNKNSALTYLEEKMSMFASYNGCEYKFGGRYLPWEFRENSLLQTQYVNLFEKHFGYKPEVIAIHAGLECAVFASKINDLDCISIGPDIFDIHTVNEKLSISSTEKIFTLLCDILFNSK